MKTSPSIGHDAKYDFLKFFLSLSVVAIHSSLYPMVLYPWLRIAVPLFFTMTGYFLFSGLRQAGCGGVTQFALRNARLYAFWLLALLGPTIYLRKELWITPGFPAGAVNFLKSLIFGSTFVSSWYITASVLGAVVVFMLSRRLREPAVTAVAVLHFCVYTLASGYRSILRQHWGLAGQWILSYNRWFDSLAVAIFWMNIGRLFANRSIRAVNKRKWLLVLALSCAALYGEWHIVREVNGTYNNDSYFMLAPLCISLFALFQEIPSVQCPGALWLKRASTVIYVSHGSLIPLVVFFCQRILQSDSRLPVFVLTVVGCIMLYAAIEFLQRRGGKWSFLRNAY